MLTAAAGPQALYIFTIAALAILSSTIIGLVDGKARALRTAVRIIAPRSRRWSDLAWYRAGITTLCLIIFALLFTGEPVVLIVLVSALEAPILSLSAVMLVYLLHARLRREDRPGVVWHFVIVAGTIAYFALFVAALIATAMGSCGDPGGHGRRNARGPLGRGWPPHYGSPSPPETMNAAR